MGETVARRASLACPRKGELGLSGKGAGGDRTEPASHAGCGAPWSVPVGPSRALQAQRRRGRWAQERASPSSGDGGGQQATPLRVSLNPRDHGGKGEPSVPCGDPSAFMVKLRHFQKAVLALAAPHRRSGRGRSAQPALGTGGGSRCTHGWNEPPAWLLLGRWL